MKRRLIFALSILLIFTPAALSENSEASFEAQLAENLTLQEEFGVQVCTTMLGGMSPYQVARFEKLKAQAETDGDVNSVFLLAECYQYGIGTEEDWTQAFFGMPSVPSRATRTVSMPLRCAMNVAWARKRIWIRRLNTTKRQPCRGTSTRRRILSG